MLAGPAPPLPTLSLALLLAAPVLAQQPPPRQPAAPGAARPQQQRGGGRTEPDTAPATVRAAREALARFDQGDPGWKVRMETLVSLAKAGPAVVPVLVDGLKKGSPPTRELAAQALVLFADPQARPALEAALGDPEVGVRLYACNALSMFGRLQPAPRYLRLRDADQWAVRRHMAYALERDDPPDAAALRKALANYDLAALDGARVGGLAPDFTLGDLKGDSHRLGDFRGKKDVLLIFLPIA